MDGPARQESPGVWHAALLYRSTAEFEAEACRFAEEAARADAAVLIACTAHQLTGLRAHLDGLGGRITWADITDLGANPAGSSTRSASLLTSTPASQPGACRKQHGRPAPRPNYGKCSGTKPSSTSR
jgi:hypothetical protein